MSTKFRNTRTKVTVDADLRPWVDNSSHKLFIYTVITFITVFALYYITKDWKGFTSPEEVNLGSVRILSHTYRRRHNRNRRRE